jgi:hypothetical protein
MTPNPNGCADYRVQPSLDRRPGGHDGKGWNRLAIVPMEPIQRCLLRPKYRQAALDTLRGMGRQGVATAYQACTSSGPCGGCHLTAQPREPWLSSWEVDEAAGGTVFVHEIGVTAAPVHSFPSWTSFMGSIDVPALRRHMDGTRATWRAA